LEEARPAGRSTRSSCAMKRTYQGSCHCGRIKFEVEADLDHVRICGIQPFRRPRTAPEQWTVNVRCLEGVDLEAIPRKYVHGSELSSVPPA
jgi:hypothetical protein